MSDQPALPAPEQSAADVPPTAQRRPRTNLVPWLYGLGFVALAAAIFYLWQYPSAPQVDASAGVSEVRAAEQKEVRAAEQKFEALDGRVARLEREPKPPSAADLGRIAAQLDALQARVSDQTRLASRLDALSGRVESLSGVNQSGIDVVKQQTQSGIDVVKQQTQSDIAVVKQQTQSGIEAIKQQLDSATDRLTALEKTASSADTVSARLDRIARIQAASFALANGQPLGDLPGAPPALSRYANAAPPTLAHLRLLFPQMQRAAIAAGQSDTGNGPFIDRVWERAQGLLTVRQGDEVVVGNASAVALTHASAALEAGDLAAAVRATSLLNPNALRAAADWLAEAKALVDARSALADMAAHI
jgi:hypothetical protein